MALVDPMPEILGQFSDNFDLDGQLSSQLLEKTVEPKGVEPSTSRVRF